VTGNEFDDLTIKNLEEEKLDLENKINKLEDLILHLKNKFINIMANVDMAGLQMIEHVVNLIDENIQQKNESEEPDSKFNNYIKNKMTKG